MKTPLTIIALLVLSVTSLSAGDGRYFSRVIHGTDNAMRIDLPTGLYMKITNFSQSAPFGFNQIGGVAVYQGAVGLDGVNVLTANSDTREVILAGPIIVYVPPVPGATLFINYFLGRN